jgi:thiamine transport system substrate-binding protein
MRRTAAIVAATLTLAACSVSNDEHTTDRTAGKTVVIATHNAWNAPKSLLAQFEKETGLKVKIVPNGDAGELTNKLVLTKDNPIADGVYGIDNSFASRAVEAGVLAAYHSHNSQKSPYDLPNGEDQYFSPVDWGDVCVNVDDVWFGKHRLAPPKTLDDLVKPAYKNLFVTPGAAASSPGFAFLLATIGRYGEDGWKDYWAKLMANGTKLAADWTEAYEVDFTAGGGNGARPIVLSYNSSPPFTIPKGKTRPTTSALLDTCFRQVEYAGVLKNAKNPNGARLFIDFMTGRDFQESLPESMYVFPVDPAAKLPTEWAKWATPAPHPFVVSPDEIDAKRKTWLTEWSDLTSR